MVYSWASYTEASKFIDKKTGTWKQNSQDRTTRTGQPGQALQDRTPRTEHRREDSQDRTARTGQPRKDSQDRTAKTRQLDRTVGTVLQAARTGQRGQDSKETTAGTGQPGKASSYRTAKQDSQDRTDGTEYSEEDSLDRSAGVSRPDKLARAGQPRQPTGKVSKDMSAWISQPQQVGLDRTAWTDR